MLQLPAIAFTFESLGLPQDTFAVVRFTGDEALSTLYRFDILLISENPDIDLDAVLQHPATLTLKAPFSGDADLPFHGILSSFEQLHQAGSYVFYRAKLRPKAWWTTLTHHNQVFLNRRGEEFLQDVLMECGLNRGLDFEFRIKSDFAPFEYVCQYAESHFDFFSRWIEFGGAYFWFEQGPDREKLICSNIRIAHTPLSGYETLVYAPPSGLDAEAGHTVRAFTLKQSPLPKKVLLRDYNYMKPNLDMKGQADIQDRGRGEVYIWADHFGSQMAGEYLARVRAEQYICRERIFRGVSTIPGIRPGYHFTLSRHYRQDFNQQYLSTTVHHEGSQERYLTTGLGLRGIQDRDALFYRNTFDCIPASIQYRSARVSKKPAISGTLTARVDAAGSGQYAELDEYGRYKVILPFDRSGREGGKASAWLRMATPYSGENCGMHFPLLKGTEVMLSFEEGDIDRPIIVGAVHNAEKTSMVTNRNEPMNVIRTAGGNELVMGDEKGKGFIGMKLPGAKGGMVLSESGEGNDSGKSTFFNVADGVFQGSFDHKTEVVVGTSNEVVGGIQNEIFVGGSGEIKAGLSWEAFFGQAFDFFKGDKVELGSEAFSYHLNKNVLGEESLEMKAGLNELTTNLVSRLKNLFTAAIATTIADAGTTMMTMQGIKNPKHMYSDGTAEVLKIVGGIGTGVTSLFGIGLMAQIHYLVQTIEMAQDGAYAAVMRLSKQDGAEIRVNNAVGAQAKFVAEVRNGNDRSNITIDPNGQNVSITNRDSASMKFQNGGSISLRVGDPDRDGIEELPKPAFSKIEVCDDLISIMNIVGNEGIYLSKYNLLLARGANSLRLDDTETKLESGDSENLTITKGKGCELKATQIDFKTDGPFRCNGKIIQLG